MTPNRELWQGDETMRRLLVICLVFLSGCATSARLYNLDTGEVLNASFTSNGAGHGNVVATTPSGAKLVGEYSTISGMNMGTGFGVANTRYNWVYTTGFSFNQPGQQYGSAVLTGDGLIIDIVYAVDPWTSHGTGVGRDNKSGRYRVQF